MLRRERSSNRRRVPSLSGGTSLFYGLHLVQEETASQKMALISAITVFPLCRQSLFIPGGLCIVMSGANCTLLKISEV